MTQLFHCEQRNGFVVFQIVDRSGIDTIFVDEGVGCNAFAFHRFPQRLITDQRYHPLF